MKIFRYFTGVICSIVLCSTNIAQNVVINATLDTTKMRIGEQQNLNLIVETLDDDVVIIPNFGKELSHNIFIVDTFNIQTKNKKGKTTRRARIPITCFEPGEYSFELGPFISGNDTIWTAPLQLSVITVQIDSTGIIRPVKPIRSPEYTFKDHLSAIYIVLAIILIITIIFFVIRYQKRIKNSFKPKKAIMKENADIKAIRELEELKGLNLFEKEEYKNYYTKLTDILREYFGEVLSIDTFEKTSDEIIQEVTSSGKVPLSVIQNLQIILKESDYVKFAKHKPTIETANLHYGLSLFCINESKHLIATDVTESK